MDDVETELWILGKGNISFRGFNLLLFLMGNSFTQRHIQGNPSTVGQGFWAQSPSQTSVGTGKTSSGLFFPSAVSHKPSTRGNGKARAWNLWKPNPSPPDDKRRLGCLSRAAGQLISPSKRLRSPGVEKQLLRSEQRSQGKPWQGVHRRIRKQTYK